MHWASVSRVAADQRAKETALDRASESLVLVDLLLRHFHDVHATFEPYGHLEYPFLHVRAASVACSRRRVCRVADVVVVRSWA